MGYKVLKVIQIVGGRTGDEPNCLFLTLQLVPGGRECYPHCGIYLTSRKDKPLEATDSL